MPSQVNWHKINVIIPQEGTAMEGGGVASLDSGKDYLLRVLCYSIIEARINNAWVVTIKNSINMSKLMLSELVA